MCMDVVGMYGLLSVYRLWILVWNLAVEDLLERLLEVADDVVDELGTDRDTDQVLGDTGSELGLLGQLLVGGEVWSNDQGLTVTDVGEVGGEL